MFWTIFKPIMVEEVIPVVFRRSIFSKLPKICICVQNFNCQYVFAYKLLHLKQHIDSSGEISRLKLQVFEIILLELKILEGGGLQEVTKPFIHFW